MEKDILAEARDAFAECVDAWADQRNRMLDDLRFARLGEQWPDKVKRDREAEGRPCLTINRMPAFIRQVVNDARQNKPSIKVHPADSSADPETAKTLDGLIRNIEYTSNADTAYDTGIDHSTTTGMGFWRVDLDYAHQDTFDLDLKIKRVANPFTVYGDYSSQEADSSDWNVAFVTEKLPDKVFKAQHPDAEASSWEGDFDQWRETDSVRVAEYWKREEVEKKLFMLSDGTVVLEEDFLRPDPGTGLSMADIAAATGVTVQRERATKGYQVTHTLLSGSGVLEEPTVWPGTFIPIIPVYGEEVNVEGRKHYFSLIHHARDAQTIFNAWRTASTELVALAPKAPFIGEEGAFDVDPDKWATANVKNHPYLEHKRGSQMPQRQPFAGPPAGALQEALNAADDMKSILGLHDASLGARSNETSGRAIMARQREGDTSTFHFIDNVNRAIRHTGRVLLDLIPHVYTGERVMRVMGEDGTPSAVTINQQRPSPDGTMRRILDVGLGKYDVTVTSGPSFTTRREEAAYQMTEMIRALPAAAPIIGPHLAKNLDWPGAEEIAKDLEALSPARQQPQAPPPDPRMAKVQVDADLAQQKLRLDAELGNRKLEIDTFNAQTKRMEAVGGQRLDALKLASDHQTKLNQGAPDAGDRTELP